MSRALQVTSHSWDRRERASERKGGGPTVTPPALWDTPAPRKQFSNEETPHPTKPLSSICFHHPCIHVSLMTSEKLSFCLWGIISSHNLEGRTRKSIGDWKELKQPQEQLQVFSALPRFTLCYFTSRKGLCQHLLLIIKKKKFFFKETFWFHIKRFSVRFTLRSIALPKQGDWPHWAPSLEARPHIPVSSHHNPEPYMGAPVLHLCIFILGFM